MLFPIQFTGLRFKILVSGDAAHLAQPAWQLVGGPRIAHLPLGSTICEQSLCVRDSLPLFKTMC